MTIIFNYQTIIHTTLYIHIKPFMKEFQSKRVQVNAEVYP